jgi:DNA polymerase-3 subunit epsilon
MSDFSGGAPLWARFINSATGQEQWRDSRAWVVPPGSERLPPPAGAREGCPLPYDWEHRSYAALDVETTGLDSFRDRVIEIGLVLFSFDGESALVEEKTWASLVNPGIPIPASATAIHGITDLDISSSPFFREIAGELASLLAGRVMVAHNAPFDAGFVTEEYLRIGSPSPILEIADSLVLLRQAVPHLFSYSLGKAAIVLGVDTGTSHRALDDARTCMHLFVRSARKLAWSCP